MHKIHNTAGAAVCSTSITSTVDCLWTGNSSWYKTNHHKVLHSSGVGEMVNQVPAGLAGIKIGVHSPMSGGNIV